MNAGSHSPEVVIAPGAAAARAQPGSPAPCWLDRDRPNALNFLRLVFAGAVIFGHSWAFAGLKADPISTWLARVTDLPGGAVDGFFIISGFLITGSWLSGRGAESYLRARVARIWPGYAVALLASALIAAIAAGPAAARYLGSIPLQSWLYGLFALDPFVLERPLSFAHNPHPIVVNGSMWTIRIEFACYLAVALAGAVGLLRRRWPVVVAAVVATAFAAHEQKVLPAVAWLHWSRFGSLFAAGAVLYLYRQRVPKNGWLALGCILLFFTYPVISPRIVFPVSGTYLIFYFAYSAPDWLKRFGARNDISYGVYLYGGPLQQLYYWTAVRHLTPLNPWTAFAVVLPPCLALAWLSWLWVEKPAKSWLR